MICNTIDENSHISVSREFRTYMKGSVLRQTHLRLATPSIAVSIVGLTVRSERVKRRSQETSTVVLQNVELMYEGFPDEDRYIITLHTAIRYLLVFLSVGSKFM